MSHNFSRERRKKPRDLARVFCKQCRKHFSGLFGIKGACQFPFRYLLCKQNKKDQKIGRYISPYLLPVQQNNSVNFFLKLRCTSTTQNVICIYIYYQHQQVIISQRRTTSLVLLYTSVPKYSMVIFLSKFEPLCTISFTMPVHEKKSKILPLKL